MKENNNNSDFMEFLKIAILVIKIFAFVISCNQEKYASKPDPIEFDVNYGLKDDTVIRKVKERMKTIDSLRTVNKNK